MAIWVCPRLIMYLVERYRPFLSSEHTLINFGIWAGLSKITKGQEDLAINLSMDSIKSGKRKITPSMFQFFKNWVISSSSVTERTII